MEKKLNIDKVVDCLRNNGIQVIQTLEEYFIVQNGRLRLVAEKDLQKLAKKVENNAK